MILLSIFAFGPILSPDFSGFGTSSLRILLCDGFSTYSPKEITSLRGNTGGTGRGWDGLSSSFPSSGGRGVSFPQGNAGEKFWGAKRNGLSPKGGFHFTPFKSAEQWGGGRLLQGF